MLNTSQIQNTTLQNENNNDDSTTTMHNHSSGDSDQMETSFDLNSSVVDVSHDDSHINYNNGAESDGGAAPKKKVKLDTSQQKLLKEELKALKQEKQRLRQEQAKAKVEKEKEKLEKERLKMKLKEEREQKQLELLDKKMQAEKEKIEKLRVKEEKREQKEREKREKEDERIRLREAKELEKQRKQEEKIANEERKKQQDELKEKKLQKSRDVLLNFLKKTKFDTVNGQSIYLQNNESQHSRLITPQFLLDRFDETVFEELLHAQNTSADSLYLSQLLVGKHKVYVKPYETTPEHDCEIINAPQNELQDKYIFIQFYENARPAYFGKLPQGPTVVSGRKPFAEEATLDYEVDSDDEWDEDGPGESLSDSEQEDDDKEKDDYVVDDCFVPHGYLSDDENENSDTDTDGSKRNGPLLKEQALMAERNRKFADYLTPHVIGCVWKIDHKVDNNKDKYNFLQQFKGVFISS